MGQEVKAIIVVADGFSADIGILHTFCSERLAAFKIPSQWEVRHQPLPRNAAGKIMKNILAGEPGMQLIEE
jgi:acyl-coenzyme A synthetase/AMP-(fatty) acid ligase